jgi:glutaredoxin
MKLYICWGLFGSPRPGGHPCKNAHDAVKEAGYEPEVVKSYGLGLLPDFLNQTSGRKEAKRLTGKTWVPVLVTDDDQVIQGSDKIAAWAKENPATQRA